MAAAMSLKQVGFLINIARCKPLLRTNSSKVLQERLQRFKRGREAGRHRCQLGLG